MDRPATVLAVGRVRRPHGVHGEILIDVETDFPERITSGVEIGLGSAAPERWVRVIRARIHKGCWLVTIEGAHSRDDVDGWRGQWVFLPAQDRAGLPPTYYYEHELEGLRCVVAGGSVLGTVRGLTDAGGGALLAVDTPRGEVLVPFRSPLVTAVRLDAGEIEVDPPAGLFDDDAV